MQVIWKSKAAKPCIQFRDVLRHYASHYLELVLGFFSESCCPTSVHSPEARSC